jgi:LacI family transcriptional regulator
LIRLRLFIRSDTYDNDLLLRAGDNLARTTIKDIAEKLNLSPSTVSRALHDNSEISPGTKRKVLETAEELNYHPNILARSLINQRSQTIGVIVPEITHNFFSAVISGIEGVAYDAGYVIILCESGENFEREVLNTQALVNNQIAGLIVSISQSTTESSHFEFLQRVGIPLVFFDRVCDDINTSKILVDDYGGAYKAVEYLIKSGYKRIAHLGGAEHLSISRDRFTGYLDALNTFEIPFNKDLHYFGGFHERDGIEGMEYLLGLKNTPDAVFAVNDPVAIGAYEVIKKRGLKIPQDIAMIGFSNNPVTAIIDPPLTTVEQPALELGKRAANILLEQIEALNAKKIYTPVREILETKLIIRKST